MCIAKLFREDLETILMDIKSLMQPITEQFGTHEALQTSLQTLGQICPRRFERVKSF